MISHRGSQKLPAFNRPQARIRLAPATYLRRNPKIGADLAARLLVLAAGIVLVQWPMVLAGLLLLIWPTRKFLSIQTQLRRGYPSAAKVLSVDPPLIACVADLSYVANESHPVLQIQPAVLTFEDSSLERGDRLAVVTVPRDGTLARAERLEVLVVSTVSDADPAPILEAIPEWHWDDLDDGLFRLDQPYRPGLYDLSR